MIDRHLGSAAQTTGLGSRLRRNDGDHLVERVVALACLLILAIGCYLVMKPFLSALLWGIILTISTWPMHVRLTRALGGRTGASAALLTLAAFTVFLIPLVLLGHNLAENVAQIAAKLQEWRNSGVPYPPPWVETVPLLGSRFHAFWSDLAAGSVEAAATLEPYVQHARAWILGFGALIGSGVLQIFISLLIALFLYRDGQRAAVALSSVLERLAGRRGPHLLDVAAGTLKSVVYGIIGTNLTEAVLAAIGFWIAGVPGAILLGFLCFFLTLVPVGPILIWLPATIWLFTIGETGWAIFLIVWSVMVFSVIEALLRTFLVSRGSDLPMMMILLGLFGGLLTFGFIGLFLGPCLIALGYTLVMEWIGMEKERRSGKPAAHSEA
ncbi:AI-2E family transporter [Skermanella mucosa]|uniref:AI-2E family transporter n=1 Tax=Skermanella mucosa TaxID=1789672 RepID=UPI00192BB929|nr:AI-2E family transporter [Skermanella mucosa]UEM19771.1 AI-2E family transporter [Skermanella mucosa]